MKLFYLLLQYFTDLHQRVKLLNQTVSSLLLMCFYIQLLSVVVQPQYNNETEMKTTINIYNIFNSISKIGRPYQSLIRYQFFRQYSFVIPMIGIALVSTNAIRKLIYKLKGNTQVKFQLSQPDEQIIRSLEKGLSIWIQIYYFAFNLYFLDLCSLSLIEQINQSQINIAFTIGISFCYLIIILFTWLNLYCQETLQFPCLPLKFENIAFKDILTIFITAASLIFSSLTKEWQHILFRMMNCLNIAIHIRNEIYRINTAYNFLALIILSSTFSYCIMDFLFYFFEDKKLQIAIVLILCPFITNILNNQKERQCSIHLEKKRNMQQIYNNLIILHQSITQSKSSFLLSTFKHLLKVQTIDEAFQKELSLLNEKTLRSDKNKQIFWHKKFIIIKYSQKNVTQALCLIHNMKNNLFFIAQKNQYIKIQLNIPYIHGLQLDHLRFEAQQILYKSLEMNSSIDLLEISELIQKKLQSSDLIDKIQKLFADKQAFYINLLKNQQTPRTELFTALYNLTDKGLIILSQLQSQLQQSKTQMLQYLLIMLHIEFFNNALQAEVVRYSQIVSEIKVDIFEKKEYIICSLNEDLINLSVNQFSFQLLEELGYRNSQKVKQLDFSQLIPFEFLETHQNLISNFLKIGQCRFYNKKSQLFVRGAENYFYCCNVEIYLQPNVNINIGFYVFLSITEEQPSVLLVNFNQQIVGFTLPLIAIFQALDFPHLPLLHLQNINLVFSNFCKLKIDETKRNFRLIPLQSNRIIYSTIYSSNGIYYMGFSEYQVENPLDKSQLTIELQKSPSINGESIIEAPRMFYELNSPISLEITKRNAQDTKFLQKSQSYADKKFYSIKSKEDSEKISFADKFQAVQLSNKIQVQDRQYDEDFNNDQASSKCSRGVLENSIFNQKYQKLNEFLTSTKQSQFHQLAIVFMTFGMLINFVYQFFNIFNCLQQFEKANADADVLAIKSYFMTPIHDCVTAQVATVSYMLLWQLFNQISIETAYQKTEFSMSAINQSYVWLKESFQKELNNKNLENFFDENQIDMQQIFNHTLVHRNISLKNALYYYLEAQYYISILNYYEVLKVQSSNDFVYYMANIQKIDDYFDELNQNTLDLVLTRIELMGSDLTKVVLKFGIMELLCITIAFSYILKFFNNNKIYFKLLTDMNIVAVQKELQKLDKIQQFLQNERSFKDYSYELNEWEHQIKSQEMSYNLKINQKRLQSQVYHQKKIYIYAYLLGSVILFIIPKFILQSLNDSFTTKYAYSSQFLTSLSVSSSAITALYELREINYMINEGLPFFYFFTDEKRLEQNVKVLQVLEQIRLFMQNLTFINDDELLGDNQFRTIFENVKSENLCNFIIHFNSTLAQDHCKLIYSGVMELGLYNTINEIYVQILTEYQNTNGFEAKFRNKTAVYQEAEIGLIASDAVLYIQEALFNGILYQKNQIVTLHKVISVLFITLDAIIMFILVFYLLPYFQHQYQTVKQMILIVPSYQFYLDKTFENNFRYFQLQNQ